MKEGLDRSREGRRLKDPSKLCIVYNRALNLEIISCIDRQVKYKKK